MGGGLGMRLGRVALVPGSCPAFCHLKYGFVHDGQLGSGRETRLEVSKRGEQKRDGDISLSCQLLTSLALVNHPKTVLYSSVLEPLSCAAGGD